MKFAEMVEHAAKNGDARYHRTDDKDGVAMGGENRDWCVGFDDEGRMSMYAKDGVGSEQRVTQEDIDGGSMELYGHDVTDGDWEVYEA